MPFIKVSSNVKSASVKVEPLLRALSKSLSEHLNRPEIYMMAEVELDRHMLFAESTDPCAFVVVRSAAQIDAEHNPKTVAAVTQIVSTHLGVDKNRIFMNLDSVASGDWGIFGQVFPEVGK